MYWGCSKFGTQLTILGWIYQNTRNLVEGKKAQCTIWKSPISYKLPATSNVYKTCPINAETVLEKGEHYTRLTTTEEEITIYILTEKVSKSRKWYWKIIRGRCRKFQKPFPFSFTDYPRNLMVNILQRRRHCINSVCAAKEKEG